MEDSKLKVEDARIVPRGQPKSGRIWKSEKTKFLSNIKSKGLKSSFEKKEKLRKDLQAIKELSRSIKADRAEEQKKKRERRKENLKRQEENRKKSEVVQVITNSSKIKKMKKKHLRQIEMRDTTKM